MLIIPLLISIYFRVYTCLIDIGYSKLSMQWMYFYYFNIWRTKYFYWLSYYNIVSIRSALWMRVWVVIFYLFKNNFHKKKMNISLCVFSLLKFKENFSFHIFSLLIFKTNSSLQKYECFIFKKLSNKYHLFNL